MLRSSQIGGYNGGEREFGRGSLGAILRLVGSEVSSSTSKGPVLSLAGLPGEELATVPLGTCRADASALELALAV